MDFFHQIDLWMGENIKPGSVAWAGIVVAANVAILSLLSRVKDLLQSWRQRRADSRRIPTQEIGK